MKQKLLFIAIAFFSAIAGHAQLYSTSTGVVGFYSKTALENIEAESKTVLSVMNIATKELAIIITNTSFSFPNKLMEEHFNEKYVESEKFPKSTFKGKINEAVDLNKDGEYKVTVTGKLNIHGVEQDRTIIGTILVKGGVIQIMATFKVKNVDHKIEIPTIVTAKISEEIDVKVDLKLLPKK